MGSMLAHGFEISTEGVSISTEGVYISTKKGQMFKERFTFESKVSLFVKK